MTIAGIIHRLDSVLNAAESWLINLPFILQVLILAIIVGTCASFVAYLGNRLLWRMLDLILTADESTEENQVKIGPEGETKAVILASSSERISNLLLDKEERDSVFSE